MMFEQVPGDGHITVAGDKGFDTQKFVAERRHMNMTPHVAQDTGRAWVVLSTRAQTRHSGYVDSQKKCKRIEECFGWIKDIALLRKLKHRGPFKVGWIFSLAVAAYNFVCLRKLIQIVATA